MRWVLAAVAALLAAFAAFGAGAAWADADDVDAFADVSDVAMPADEDAGTAGNDGGIGGGIATQSDGGDEDAGTPMAGAFAKPEYTVEVGQTFLVGLAPSEADAQSPDEERAKWYEDWVAATEGAGVDVSEGAGWLLEADGDGVPIDYDGITGIVTSDKATFELFGEFPEWKVDDEGGEYRWWYGLLGKAMKPGDVELAIVYRQPGGENLIADTCTVHVVKSEAKASARAQRSEAKTSATAPRSEADSDSASVESTEASIKAQSAEEGASQESSDTAAGASDASADSSSSNTATSSGLTSKSSANGGSGLSSENATNKTGNSASSASASPDAAYPKEVAATAAGSKLSASLMVNDAAAEEAFAKLSGSGQLSLSVEPKDKLGEAAEASLATVAKTGGVDIAGRYSVSVLDADGKEVAVDGVSLTVKLAADDAVKALSASSVQVWYVGVDGSTEKKTAALDGGYLTFETAHLSDYAVMGTKAGSGSGASSAGGSGLNSNSNAGASSVKGLPQTGDSLAYLAVVLAFVAGFSASSALNARKRLREMPFDFGQHAA